MKLERDMIIQCLKYFSESYDTAFSETRKIKEKHLAELKKQTGELQSEQQSISEQIIKSMHQEEEKLHREIEEKKRVYQQRTDELSNKEEIEKEQERLKNILKNLPKIQECKKLHKEFCETLSEKLKGEIHKILGVCNENLKTLEQFQEYKTARQNLAAISQACFQQADLLEKIDFLPFQKQHVAKIEQQCKAYRDTRQKDFRAACIERKKVENLSKEIVKLRNEQSVKENELDQLKKNIMKDESKVNQEVIQHYLNLPAAEQKAQIKYLNVLHQDASAELELQGKKVST